MPGIIASPVEPYRPLSSDAYELLREAIILGHLAPGERIVEAEIARQMTISRAPIREAIRQLERDGLVEYRPRRGAYVVKLSPDEVRDVYDIRALLEGHAARLAAQRITPEGLAELARLLDDMRAAARQDDLTRLIAVDVDFHAVICHTSGSPRLEQFWNSLHPHGWTLLSGVKVTEYTLTEIADRHEPILEALRQRDGDRVESAIRQHITDLANRVLAHLDVSDGTPG